MNPEAEGLNGQANLVAWQDSANSGTPGTVNGTLSDSLTLEPEVCSNGTSSTPLQQSPSLKNRLQHQRSHQGDSPKGSYACLHARSSYCMLNKSSLVQTCQAHPSVIYYVQIYCGISDLTLSHGVPY